MLRYKVHQLYLDGLKQYHLPLPKLTSEQVLIVANHLKNDGLKLTKSPDGALRASLGERRLTIHPSGLAWSNLDLLDILAPCVPNLLQAGKAKAQSNPFYLAKKGDGAFQVQLFPRMEARRTWRELRRIGGCALTPDEQHIIRMLLEGSGGKVGAITDFPTEDSRRMRVGRKNYFRSFIEVGDFAESLCALGETKSRNSFLPINALLILDDFAPPSRERLREASEELGEWCFLEL